MSESEPVEISKGLSKLPCEVASGQPFTLQLAGIMNTLHELADVNVRISGNVVHLDAYATTPPSDADAGIEQAWEKSVEVPALAPGKYLLKFNGAFGYVRWQHTITAKPATKSKRAK